jgi:hypothetical protein
MEFGFREDGSISNILAEFSCDVSRDIIEVFAMNTLKLLKIVIYNRSLQIQSDREVTDKTHF